MDQSVPSARAPQVSTGQFALFRLLFGAYLLQHFLCLARSDAAFLRGAAAPEWARPFPALLALAGGAFMIGFRRRWAAGLLWSGWAVLPGAGAWFNPSAFSAAGAILLLSLFVPEGERWRGNRGRGCKPGDWFFPAGVYGGAWLLLAVGYAVDGFGRLGWPDGIDGLALPGTFRAGFLALPDGMPAAMTWVVLAAELACLPLSFTRRGRRLAWLVLLALQASAALVMGWAGLNAGVVMLHLFTFDAGWLPVRRDRRVPVLLYDGACGLCNAVVRWLLREDPAGRLRFAPLQSAPGQAWLRAQGLPTDDFSSLVFVPDWNRPARDAYRLRTDGALAALDELGGVWRVLSWLRCVPRWLRDPLYRLVAHLRYAIFGEYRPTPRPERDGAERFLG
jgi:predicted DCC family thiol-disulfide oxidoreductase YuxK